ncbi:FIG01248689: hypothetical protein [hydrothermal vent metagenome]|uniref:Stage II sporulation protein M n=1 Tax=hydrothermal vent metagenome TaxID=652676 RepID=A0A3B0XGD2_9ZZZZ
MKQIEFEKNHALFWSDLEKQIACTKISLLKKLVNKFNKNKSKNSDFGESFPEHYRLVCHHLSLARSRYYSPLLVERLEKLVFNAHQIYYKRNTHLLRSILIYFTSDFSQSVRKEWRWILLSFVLFFGSLFSMLVTLQYYPDMVYTVISGEQLAQIEAMYDPSQDKIGRDRDSGTDFQMFGYYILNNTGIGLKTFASGLLFCVGSVITLLFNGLFIGSIAGYLTQIGFGSTFWPFVSGHSAMELSAIVLSGAAGLKLGFSIISPGRKSRLKSLNDSASEALHMMYGVATMFFIAAFIEAYWSSMSNVPAMIKYLVGIANWLLLFVYFIFLGQKSAVR